ncbi:MAG: polysaccharide deacetylase family protein [Chitinivibrionales bacterium]|nr:polysaccharide deacetylase family protein [Chitinivibrionales bacterium]MBD3358106.1 polysaccharide deacetylase family protein [Chitinivibrionales bacterium]
MQGKGECSVRYRQFAAVGKVFRAVARRANGCCGGKHAAIMGPWTISMVLFVSCTVYQPAVFFEEPRRLVLLTFDDGPNGHGRVTERLLAVLRKHDVKAMFSLIGTNVEKYPAIVRRIHADGHVIANHGYSEWPVLFRSTQSIRREMDQCTQVIRAALGDSSFVPYGYRPAFGWYNRRTHRCALERGYPLCGFNCYPRDAQADSSQAGAVVYRALRCLGKRGGGVVVMHDGKADHERLLHRVRRGRGSYERLWIPATVDSIIVRLKKEGFCMPPLTEGPANTLPVEYLNRFEEFFF